MAALCGRGKQLQCGEAPVPGRSCRQSVACQPGCQPVRYAAEVTPLVGSALIHGLRAVDSGDSHSSHFMRGMLGCVGRGLALRNQQF